MAKTPQGRQFLKELATQLKRLQEELALANKAEGKDDYINVKLGKDQARFERVKVEGEKDKAFGKFLILIEVTAKKSAVFLPLSIASGKKATGFMYQIEGTAEGVITTADVTVRGKGISQVTLGTLLYAKIPTGITATFRIQTTIRGKAGKTYKIIINRINYKLALTDARYQQYLKPIVSDSVKLS